MSDMLKPPFWYFGGKSRAGHVCWRAFGADVANFVEPFCGSLGMLLARPGGAGKIETVNDAACAIANFWRAIQAEPDVVAAWCDRPVNECDMHAIHAWLVRRLAEIEPQLRSDPLYYDTQVAGWWVWGAAIWIGGGWCGGVKRGLPRPNLNGGQGVMAPSIAQRPHLSHDNGVIAARLPSIGNDRAINGLSAPPALQWFRDLSARLRRVRVCCGDWKRVLGPSVLGKGKNVGGRKPCAVFMDPPYDIDGRDQYLYNEDERGLSTNVREWCLEHGDDPDLRLALCGYEFEHVEHMPASWTMHAWKGARGYAGTENDNREQERIWFSPFCLPIDQQRSLFA